MNPPILEAVLTDSFDGGMGPGGTVKFRWHQTPCPGNEQVSIFRYHPSGEYRESSYINRSSARDEWRYLLTVGYAVTQQPKTV